MRPCTRNHSGIGQARRPEPPFDRPPARQRDIGFSVHLDGLPGPQSSLHQDFPLTIGHWLHKKDLDLPS